MTPLYFSKQLAQEPLHYDTTNFSKQLAQSPYTMTPLYFSRQLAKESLHYDTTIFQQDSLEPVVLYYLVVPLTPY